jgi:hypothetical protein
MLFTAYRLTICLAVVMLVALGPLAHAQDSAADKAQLKSYVLDAGKVNRYIAALNALAMANASDPAITREYQLMEDEQAGTLANMRASVARHPRILAFFQRQNLTADDAVMIPMVILMADVASTVPGQLTDTVSPAQISFINANGPLMQRLQQAQNALEGSP